MLVVLLAPGLPAGAASPEGAGDRVLVGFHPGATPNDVAEERAATGARLVRHIDSIGVAVFEVRERAAGRALVRFSQSPVVEYAEPDGVVEADRTNPNDQHWSKQWGTKKVDAPTAWDHARGSPSTVVAVLDTGVDPTQPDLLGALVPGRNVVRNGDEPLDDHGHGTKVAGIIAARTDNGIGIAGMCWHCGIMPVKVLRSDGSGSWSDVATGITWAADNGANVINMSLSGTSSSKSMERAVAYARGHGVVLVASAGNSGNSALRYPAAYPDVVAVAGTDQRDDLYRWSNHGSWVDVAAPGCNYTTWSGDAYGDFCGTSSAAPVVAGLAGLLVSHEPAASAAAVETAITATARHIGSVVAYGRVEAHAAVLAVNELAEPPDEGGDDAREDPEPPSDEPDAVGDSLSFRATLNNKHSLRAHTLHTAVGDRYWRISASRAPRSSRCGCWTQTARLLRLRMDRAYCACLPPSRPGRG